MNNVSQKNKYIKPIFTSFIGNKYKELDNILKYIPKEYNLLLDPFCGSLALPLQLLNGNDKKAVLNDINRDVIDFYNNVKIHGTEEIFKFIPKRYEITKDLYNKTLQDFSNKKGLEKSANFLLIQKCCFRGFFRYDKEGIIRSNYNNRNAIFDYIKNPIYEEIFKRCDFTNNNYDVIFKDYNDENNFMFLDPPYDDTWNDYYGKFSKEEHIKLSELFKTTKIKCLMIIKKTPFIEDLYKDYIFDEYSKEYNTNISTTQKRNVVHLVIKNYPD